MEVLTYSRMLRVAFSLELKEFTPTVGVGTHAPLRRRLYSTLSVRLPVGETPSALPSSGNHPAPPPPHTHPHTHAHTHTRTRTRSLFGPRSRWGHAHGWATHCWATLTVRAAFNPESLRTQTRGGIFQQAPCTSICF